DGQPGPAEEELRRQLDRARVWQRLEQINQTLVPGLHPRGGQLKYPSEASKALAHARWLAEQEQAHPWIAPLLDAFLCQKDLAQGGLTGAVRGHLAREQLRERLILDNGNLVPGYTADLEEAVQVRFPKRAALALDEAAHLLRLAQEHTWIN